MNRTVEELLDGITSRELAEWAAFLEIEAEDLETAPEEDLVDKALRKLSEQRGRTKRTYRR